MRLTSRWVLSVLGLAIFCLGMLTTVALSRFRTRWAYQGASIPPDFVSTVGTMECLGAIDDVAAVKVHGGTISEGDERLILRQREGEWYVYVSRDRQDKHLKELSLCASYAGEYTIFYDSGLALRKQFLSCRSRPGEGIDYMDANGDGVFEWICGPKLGMYLFTNKGWMPAMKAGGEGWIQVGANSWRRADEVDGVYAPVGEPVAHPPSSQPSSQPLDNE